MLVLLDRGSSMNAVRGNGHTRCVDALLQAELDVRDFASGQPSRAIAIWTFSGATVTPRTAGFVDSATALSALAALDGASCGGTSPLADGICAAVAAFPSGLVVGDKVLALSSAGVENASTGPCAGPASTIGPPPPANYSAGSWESRVYLGMQGNAVAQIRHWDTFGDPLTPPDPTSAASFFIDLAGSTAGGYKLGDDVNIPPTPQLPAVPAWLPISAAMALLLAASWFMRRRFV